MLHKHHVYIQRAFSSWVSEWDMGMGMLNGCLVEAYGKDKVRGREKNKCFWDEKETQVLIEKLQDMACDPSWKTGFFQSNDVEKKVACERDSYDNYCKNHKETSGMWDFKFPYLNQLELVYGRDRATGGVVEGFREAIRNMESQQNVESRGENLGCNARRMARKAKETFIKDKDPKKKRTSGNNSGASLEGIDQSFRTFVEGFNAATFATLANDITTSMTDDNTPLKSCL
ncbi:hypothetical protein Tco_0503277 [Tanacetum coccineum]